MEKPRSHSVRTGASGACPALPPLPPPASARSRGTAGKRERAGHGSKTPPPASLL